MKNPILLAFGLVLLSGCSTVNYCNKALTRQIPANQLKSDVDYVHRKLQKLHPNLYWYISKAELDRKFDSLKTTITQPMTSRDFYNRLSPVVAAVRQGHAMVIPPVRLLRWTSQDTLLNFGPSPLSKFEFETFDNKVYITRNNSADSTIKAGTELLSVNGIKPAELVARYRNNFTSDGFNQTFKTIRMSKGIAGFFYYENDITDSVQCTLKLNDSIRTVWLRRLPVKTAKSTVPMHLSKAEREKRQTEKARMRYLGYDPVTRKYSKNLSFFGPDSSIALMKINDFMKGQSKRFYHESFGKLARLKTKTLIIDLRDNPGGKIKEINELYSYLVDSDFIFMDKSLVASRTSLLHLGYFNGIPWGTKVVRGIFYPLYFTAMIIPFSKVRKDSASRYYYSYSYSKPQHPKADNFKGKVIVLINGGSFSASCLLSSDLKGSKRASFIGTETGGAFNGTVAGIIPVYTLPHSKIRVRFGLATLRPYYKTNIDGRGIFPDVEVNPTLEDRLKGVDPELNEALEAAKSNETGVSSLPKPPVD
jgi:Periplasmic protease